MRNVIQLGRQEVMQAEILQALGEYIPHPIELEGFDYICEGRLEYLYSRDELTESEDVLFSLLIKCAKSFNRQKKFGYE